MNENGKVTKPLDYMVVSRSLDDLVEWLASGAANELDQEKIRRALVAGVSADGQEFEVKLVIPVNSF
jgi:hypothetical protein